MAVALQGQLCSRSQAGGSLARPPGPLKKLPKVQVGRQKQFRLCVMSISNHRIMLLISMFATFLSAPMHCNVWLVLAVRVPQKQPWRDFH